MSVPPAGRPGPDYDVVVVGAGSIGQLTALMLANKGHRVAVLDKQPAPYPLPRAVGISGEGMRLLQIAGLSNVMDEVIERIPPEAGHGVWLAADGTEIFRHPIPNSDEGAGWPGFAGFSQPDLERILEDRLAGHPGVDLRRGQLVTSVSQDADRALVTARASNTQLPSAASAGTETLTARLVLGCDGANSVVREFMDTSVEDLGFSFDWLVVDVQSNDGRVWDPPFAQIVDPARPATAVCGGAPGRRRFEFMRLPGEPIEELNRADTAWKLLARWNLDADNSTLLRHAVYAFCGQWATSWHHGRLILAGDAAHLMPPFLAQGFNSGVRDVAALAWRADLVLSNRAPLDIFASYTSERLPHVRQIIEEAVQIGRMLCITDPGEAAERDQLMLAARDHPEIVPPPPTWRLGPGLGAHDDPGAGVLGIQAIVEHDGRTGLFDDVFGGGRFVMLSRAGDPRGVLGEFAAHAWGLLGGVTATFGSGGDTTDVGQAYARWFTELDADLIVLRPDFNVLATARQIQDADRLITNLAEALQLSDPP
jgi:2-polyprenyl-6-methoxyphenol hydroxylase-like FAD-dependent oxidoreductase